MLENKRDRLKTFLRKIDEKAIFRIKHFMKDRYPVESGGISTVKVKKVKGSSKRKVEPRKAFSLDDTQLEIQQQHQTITRPAPVRSQTFDCDGALEKPEGTGTQSSFIKHNKTFHTLFPDIPESEDLLHAYICALHKEVPYHGRLYITENHACFYSSVLLKDTKVVIPVSSIHIVKKQNTALLVPNALSIRTIQGDKFLFVSMRNRDACFQLLTSVCPQLEDRSTNSSPVFSSAENSLDRIKLVNSSQSSLEDSFDQLDASTPNLLEDTPPTPPHTEPVPNGETAPYRSTYSLQHSDTSSEDLEGVSWISSVTEKARSFLIQREATTLNTLLFIYLILVVLLLLSSGYIGLRIVALEQQLTSLGALPEFSLHTHTGYKGT